MTEAVQTTFEKTQEMIAGAKVGDQLPLKLTIDGLKSSPSLLHCFEVTEEEKKFKLFIHGLEIKELVAIKLAGKWTPK